MNYTIGPLSMGWCCPKCGRVYSPTQMMCLYCPTKEVLTNSTSTNNLFEEVNLQEVLEWRKNKNETNQ